MINDVDNDFDTALVLEKPVLLTYMSRRSEDLRLLTQALGRDSVQEFNQIGHRILGSARTFGFPELETMALQMNDMTTQVLSQQGPLLLTRFSEWILETTSKIQQS